MKIIENQITYEEDEPTVDEVTKNIFKFDTKFEFSHESYV
jgi:hypothetical protein